MKLRKQLEALILQRLLTVDAAKHDKALIQRQLADQPLSWLCNLYEGELAFVDNRAVFARGPYKYAIVLWQTEYVPQPLNRRHEQYNTAPMIMSDLPAYRCPITGDMITSRSRHRENLKRHGCEVAEASTPRDTWREDKAEDHARKKAVHDAMQQLNYH